MLPPSVTPLRLRVGVKSTRVAALGPARGNEGGGEVSDVGGGIYEKGEAGFLVTVLGVGAHENRVRWNFWYPGSGFSDSVLGNVFALWIVLIIGHGPYLAVEL